MTEATMNRKSFLTTSAGLLALAAWRPTAIPGLAAERRPGAAITVDPRIELFNVILYLGAFRGFGGNTPLTGLDFPYLAGVEERFGPFREHDVVRQYEAMAARGFWLTHPPSAMLHLSPPPPLAEEIPVNEFTVRMAGGREALDTFLGGACRFADESGFMSWFQDQAPLHRAMVARYRDRLEWDYVADLVEYYGDRRESYTVILAPLSHGGGFGPRVRRPDGRYDAFAIIGPRTVEDGVPDFGAGRVARYLFWHEFSHSHVNHLTDRHLDRLIGPVSVLQGDVRAEVEEYVPWEVHVSDWVSEHVVRAVTTRLTHWKLGPAEAGIELRREVERFPFVAEVCDALVEYEQDRARYPTLAAYYPRIVDVFQDLARS
jgi:hypothetical protein